VTFVAEEVDPAGRERIAHRVARAAGELTRRINGRAPSSRVPSRTGQNVWDLRQDRPSGPGSGRTGAV
jgi:hypothetical protein